MMVFVVGLLVWSTAAVGAAVLLWRSVVSHRKVYGLIVLHGLYSAGVFFLYGLTHGGVW